MQVSTSLFLAAIVLTVGRSSVLSAADINGLARVVDGDTLVIGSLKVRLEGIDAPETDQICLDAVGERWSCGKEARDRIIAHIGNREVSCVANGTDSYKRTLATCRIANEDINAWIVREGWALAYVRYSLTYAREEEDARVHQRGLWGGAFIAPWDWRHRNGRTTIKGAYSVPVGAQAALVPSGEMPPSPQCTIKGVIDRRGERIYHLSNQQSYSRIRMDSKPGRRWFCSSDEAEAAGWRKALR